MPPTPAGSPFGLGCDERGAGAARNTDHRLTGVAGDGEAIECEYNNGWRWQPTG